MKTDYSPDIAFREVQYFRQIWIWLVILFIAGLMWYTVISRLVGRPLGDEPMPAAMLIIFWLLFGIGLPLIAFYARLITEVRNDGVYFRYIPFHFSFRRILFSEIKNYTVRTYRPLWEYGGWGIRYNLRGGWAYNVSGNRGVQFELINGRRILLGSQQPEALAQAIAGQIK